MTSRAPVNPAGRAHRVVRAGTGSDPIKTNVRADPVATAPGSDTDRAACYINQYYNYADKNGSTPQSHP